MSNLSKKNVLKEILIDIDDMTVAELKKLLLENKNGAIYRAVNPVTIHHSTTPTNNSIENLTWETANMTNDNSAMTLKATGAVTTTTEFDRYQHIADKAGVTRQQAKEGYFLIGTLGGSIKSLKAELNLSTEFAVTLLHEVIAVVVSEGGYPLDGNGDRLVGCAKFTKKHIAKLDRYQEIANITGLTREISKGAYFAVSFHATIEVLRRKFSLTKDQATLLRNTVINVLMSEGGYPVDNNGQHLVCGKKVTIHYTDSSAFTISNVRNFKIGDVWKPNCIVSFTEVKHVYDIKSNPLGSAVTNTKYEVQHNYILNEHVKAVEVSWLNGFRTELYKFHEKTSFAEILAK